MPRPSLKSFLELPISVRHCWDGYAVVDQALEELEQGQFLNAALLADAVYTDDRIIGCLSTRVNALFGLPMEFKWQGQEDTQQATGDDANEDELVELKKLIAKKAEDNWEAMLPSAALREFVRWGLLLNAGPAENVWDWGTDGYFYPTLKTWNPQFLYWRYDTRSYWLIHQGGQTELAPGDGRWVLFSPTGHNHGWLYGLIRALGKLWLDRVFAFRDWARASEKYSLGILLADMPADASVEDKMAFEGAVGNMPNESAIVLPKNKEGKGFDLRMMQTDTAANWQSFKERIQQLDTSIAVALLGQNLSTEVSKGGSRAAAQVHDNVRGDFLKADVTVLSSTLKTQVLGPWVRYNWEDDAKRLGVSWEELVPNVTWIVDPPEDKTQTAAALASIASAIPQLAGTDADTRAILEQNSIPVLEQRNAPATPPPGNVNERPRGEGLEGEVAPGLDESEPDTQLHATSRKVPPGLKPGARKGQLLADDLAEAATRAGSKAMDDRRKKLEEIIRTSDSYEEIRDRVKSLYRDLKPSAELRAITEKAQMAAELVGRLSAHVDHKHGRG